MTLARRGAHSQTITQRATARAHVTCPIRRAPESDKRERGVGWRGAGGIRPPRSPLQPRGRRMGWKRSGGEGGGGRKTRPRAQAKAQPRVRADHLRLSDVSVAVAGERRLRVLQYTVLVQYVGTLYSTGERKAGRSRIAMLSGPPRS